jgi:tetratricopeptide (TPR) repeat protein
VPEKDKATKEPTKAGGSARDDDDGNQDELSAGAENAPEDKAREASEDDDPNEPGSVADDDASARVADALGVGVEGEGEGADDEAAKAAEAKEPAAPPNRQARRREEAIRRRKKRAGASGEGESEALPKDRNARAKELLSRRQEQAAEKRPVALLPGEMVDDALARSWSASIKWLRANFQILQWVIVAGVVGVAGYMVYVSRTEKTAGNASATLIAAVAAERGRVMAEDKREEDEKKFDPTRVFATPEERAEAALASYNQVIDQHAGTGAAMLAKLGQAGVLLEKRDYQHALDAYNAVIGSPLAAADADFKGRALEGAGLAKEGKGDLDGALETFVEVGKVDAKGYKELSKYHQARITLAKGEKEKAKDLLKELLALKGDDTKDPTKDILNPVDKGTLPGLDSQAFPYLKTAAEELLRSIDPSALPSRMSLSSPGGPKLTPEQRERLLQRAREAAEKMGADPNGAP